MWDTLLNTIDNAITPKIAVSRWHGDTESIQLVSQGINLVYRFKKADQVYLI